MGTLAPDFIALLTRRGGGISDENLVLIVLYCTNNLTFFCGNNNMVDCLVRKT